MHEDKGAADCHNFCITRQKLAPVLLKDNSSELERGDCVKD
jgi:hypothetical protein